AADVLAFRHDPRPGGGNPIALEHQTREPTVDVAAVLHPRHDLLADIAALGEAHDLIEARFGKDQGLVDVPAVPRNTGLHAKRVERLHAHGNRAIRDGSPEGPAVSRRGPAVKARDTALAPMNHAHGLARDDHFHVLVRTEIE